MVSHSSREARSAKREALRNALEDRNLGSGRVTKSIKSRCKPVTKKVTKLNSNKFLKAGLQKITTENSKDSPQDSTNDIPEYSTKDCPQDSARGLQKITKDCSQDSAKGLQKITKDNTEVRSQDSSKASADDSPRNTPLEPSTLGSEEAQVEKTSNLRTTGEVSPVAEPAPLSPVPELQNASVFSPDQFIDLPAEFTDGLTPIDSDIDSLASFEELSKRYLDTPSPMSPLSPLGKDKLCEPPSMSDEELQTYLQEFEAVSSGADVPGGTDSDYSDVSSMPVSPLLDEARYMQDTRAPSPLSYTPDSVDNTAFDQPVSQEELKIDDYFNFINIADTSSDSVSFACEDTAPKRKVPFCVYQARNDMHPVSSSFNPKNRTLLAAWQTMAPDVQFGTRDAYVRAVLLAAASLTQRSLISGRARETMAPALGTSH